VAVVYEKLIKAPIELVWEIFDNIENVFLWKQDLIRIDPIGEQDEAVGSQHDVTFLHDGAQLQIREKILQYGAPFLFRAEYSNKYGVMTALHTFQQQGENTSWMQEVTFNFHGIYKLLAPVGRNNWCARVAVEMEAFKQMVHDGTYVDPDPEEA